jgi:hypothetical protein
MLPSPIYPAERNFKQSTEMKIRRSRAPAYEAAAAIGFRTEVGSESMSTLKSPPLSPVLE